MHKRLGEVTLSLILSTALAFSPLGVPLGVFAQEQSDQLTETPTDGADSPTSDDEQPSTNPDTQDPTEDPEGEGSQTPSDEEQPPADEEGTDANQEQADPTADQTGQDATEQPGATDAATPADASTDGQTVEVEATTDEAGKADATEVTLETAATFGLVARGYASGTWSDWSTAGPEVQIGTEGKRLEAFSVKLDNLNGTSGSITYKAHVQSVGWQNVMSDGAVAGLEGKKKRIEAVWFNLSGDVANSYDLWYRACVEGSWMGWAHNGDPAGTTGKSKRIEAVQLRLVTKNGDAPGSTDGAYEDRGLQAQAHVQKKGWMAKKSGMNVTVGTTGKSLRMEAIKLNRPALDVSGNIEYQAHVQKKGWMSVRKNGQLAGTSGKGLRIEALRVRLTGELADRYDVWYRVHVSKVGWLSWATNWEQAGTQGLSMRVESIQVALVPKGEGAPAADNQKSSARFMKPASLSYDAYQSGAWDGWVGSGKTSGTTGTKAGIRGVRATISSQFADGSITYSAHVSGTGWVDWTGDGQTSGNLSKNVEAVKFELEGELSKFFNVYYRAYVPGAGWLGWAKNGQAAGSTGAGKAITAYQIKLLSKSASAPGSTSNHVVGKSYFRSNSTSKQTESADGTMYHNVPWAGQPNSYYCGPTAGYMILSKLGATRSAKGASLTISNVADEMGTSTLGYTSFNDRAFAHGLNEWLGSYIYTTVSTPSYSQIKAAVIDSFNSGYPVAVDAHERSGGPHYNGHNDGNFSHILVIDGYNPNTDAVYFADPGAGVLWGGASSKFWYPSLRDFTENFLGYYPWRDGIGMMCKR